MYSRVVRLIFIFSSLAMFNFCISALSVRAQCNALPGEQYRVNSVRVNTLFGSTPKELKEILAKHKGETYYQNEHSFVLYNKQTFQGVSSDFYKKEVQVFFDANENLNRNDAAYGINQQNGLQIRSKISSVCVKVLSEDECKKAFNDDTAKCLDVIVEYRVIPINTESLSSNFLELARSNQLRFYRQLPKPLRVFDPRFWVEQDRKFGTSATGSVSTDLLNFASNFKENPKEPSRTQLRLEFEARKSLRDSYYTADSKLNLSRNINTGLLRKINLNAGFTAKKVPQGNGIYFRRSVSLGGSVQLKVNQKFLEQIAAGADYRRTQNSFSKNASVIERSTENTVASRITGEGKISNGFYRIGAWFDYARPENVFNAYSRFALKGAYAKSFSFIRKECRIETVDGRRQCILPKKNAPSIGIETEFGIGKIWGDAPDYARFYGGNTTGNFLYDSLDKSSITDFPSNPLMRSFGNNKLGVRAADNTIRGATASWNFNVSISLPIPKWSKPLIPSEVIITQQPIGEFLSCGDCVSLKTLLKNQVAGGKTTLIDALAYQKLTPQQRDDLNLDLDENSTPEERERFEKANLAFDQARLDATPEAEQAWQQITPAVEYIADKANLYSIKPLILFDAAKVSAFDAPRQRTRLALGGGLQFNVVVAKFEIGYMRTLRKMSGGDRGNFFVRMVFEKLF